MGQIQETVKKSNYEDIRDKRCKCNKLLCVIKGSDIEIKCNKCKRMLLIKTAGILDIDIK